MNATQEGITEMIKSKLEEKLKITGVSVRLKNLAKEAVVELEMN